MIETCGRCGVPLMISREHVWGSNGVISLAESAHNRMVFYESETIDRLFRGIEGMIGIPIVETEIGEIIPETIIEAQRRQIKTGWDVESWNRDGSTFQQMLALRGLGNLTKFEGDRTHLDIVVENACLHLPMIGTTQALVELAYKADRSTCEWELANDGDLSININISN